MQADDRLLRRLYGVAFLYNICQVMLCSYMCLEAAIVARRHDYNLSLIHI